VISGQCSALRELRSAKEFEQACNTFKTTQGRAAAKASPLPPIFLRAVVSDQWSVVSCLRAAAEWKARRIEAPVPASEAFFHSMKAAKNVASCRAIIRPLFTDH